MKKAIMAVFAFAMMFVGHSAFASNLWNGASNDCQTLAIANHNTGAGVSSPCWSSSTVSANAGETVNVRIYYHNSSNLFGTGQTATNVRVYLTPSTGTSTTQTFSGRITSDQGDLTGSPVTVTIPTSQSVTFGSVRWYTQNTSQTLTTLLNGQNGSEIINGGGLYIGDIAAGWATQGSVVTSFRVSSNSTPNPTYNCTISNFTANGSTSTTVQSGSNVNLVWNTSNCTSANLSGPNLNSSSVSTSGSQYVYPTSSGTYTLTAIGSNGASVQSQVYVNVNNIINPPVYSSCTILNFTANGSTSLTVNSGSAVTLSWNTNNCSSVSISNVGNNLPYSYSQIIYPTYSGSYTLTANSYNSGTAQSQVYINVNTVLPPQPPVTNACAVTGITTNVTRTSATLNGVVSNANYYNTTGYFEYGTTVTNLTTRTTVRSLGGNAAFVESLTGLNPDTTYYYRFVANCQNGLSYGTIDTFTTQGTIKTNTTTIIQGTTVVGTQSPIMLKIENRYQAIGIGDPIDYVVTYKNIGKSLLTRPVLQVIAPKGIVLTNASRGTYSTDTNTLTVPLEDLRPGEGGVVYVQGLVNDIPSNSAQIVTTAVLVYTSPNGAQENAIAYVLNNPKNFNQNTLGAAAFFAGIFPTTLLGWLLLVILILLLVLLTRRYYRRPVVAVPTYPSSH